MIDQIICLKISLTRLIEFSRVIEPLEQFIEALTNYKSLYNPDNSL